MRLTKHKNYCPGSEQRVAYPVHAPGTNPDRVLALCGTCRRITVPTGGGYARHHSVRGENTRSHDKTMETLYLMHGGKAAYLYVRPSDGTALYGKEFAYGSSERTCYPCLACSDANGLILILPDLLEEHYQGHVRGYAEWVAENPQT